MKIISWNINQFLCNEYNWADYQKKEKDLMYAIQWPIEEKKNNTTTKEIRQKVQELKKLEKIKHTTFNKAIGGLKKLLNKETPDILFLNEIPYNARYNSIVKESKEYYKQIKELMKENYGKDNEAYSIVDPYGGGNFVTIAIVKKKEDKKDKIERCIDDTNIKDYKNRRVVLEYKQKKILGIHMDYDEDNKSLNAWKKLSTTDNYSIIIGDLNVDDESTKKWPYMIELLKKYSEPNGLAKREQKGKIPPTHYGEHTSSHLDYALVREDLINCVKILNEPENEEKNRSYTILTDYKEYSDHYPIMLEIDL